MARGLADDNALFNFFLVDVEMGACQITSRIKHAMGSVQLFVQRCLMNLEEYSYSDVNQVKQARVTFDPEMAKEWQWMQSYRVWEANRKIGEVIDGHLRLKAARKLGIKDIPVILCDEWTPAQVKAYKAPDRVRLSESILAIHSSRSSESD